MLVSGGMDHCGMRRYLWYATRLHNSIQTIMTENTLVQVFYRGLARVVYILAKQPAN